MNRWLCGVPERNCQGTKTQVNMLLGITDHAHKTHSSSHEAFRCYVHYLLEDGYKQIDSRTFQKNDEPILILSKKSHFGARLRGGKAGRSEPRRGSGVII